jgi:hypothetical protein
MYFSKNIKDWHLVYENGAYALFKSCIQMNLFENIFA